MYILFVPHQPYAVFLLKDAKTFEAFEVLSTKAFDILRKGLSTIAELPFRKNDATGCLFVSVLSLSSKDYYPYLHRITNPSCQGILSLRQEGRHATCKGKGRLWRIRGTPIDNDNLPTLPATTSELGTEYT